MPNSMQLTEQIPNDPPLMAAKVLLLEIIPVPLQTQEVHPKTDPMLGQRRGQCINIK